MSLGKLKSEFTQKTSQAKSGGKRGRQVEKFKIEEKLTGTM